MQVYQDLNVLTARPSLTDMAAIPHALYGILDGADLCSAARWAEMARNEISDARKAGRIPILCGGTGLYIRTLLNGIAPVPEIPGPARDAARALYARLGNAAFHSELAKLDPDSAKRLHPNDTQRLTRAYEVVTATGKPLAHWQQTAPGTEPIEAMTFVMLPPRDNLYRAIDGRFGAMMKRGALEEVERLMARALDPAMPVMKALGVPELISCLSGNLAVEEAIAQAQQSSRNYAKRQYTWFSRQLISCTMLNEQLMKKNADLICQKVTH